MKVKVISLPYIFHVLYVLCFTRPLYQVSLYMTIGPLVFYYKIKILHAIDLFQLLDKVLNFMIIVNIHSGTLVMYGSRLLFYAKNHVIII